MGSAVVFRARFRSPGAHTDSEADRHRLFLCNKAILMLLSRTVSASAIGVRLLAATGFRHALEDVDRSGASLPCG